MLYESTRGNYKKVTSAKAINLGMVPEGGLFVPEEIPKISIEKLAEIQENNYQVLAKYILKQFLTDYSESELEDCISLAYNGFRFDSDEIAPLEKIDDDTFMLELWHGPTAAFKDMALQIMPHLLVKAKEKTKTKRDTVILVATSGDTGKAALEGFKNVKGVQIIVFYPDEGVSNIQKLQMQTTDGMNTYVAGIKGNFDDCQTNVKEIFSDKDFIKKINKKGLEFSSANSINWGRLVPQIIYYFKAYFSLVNNQEIALGEKADFCVPTGNFGNILAGYYAKEMGLPINKLICASNKNKILSDFFKTGVYDKNREFHKTFSPSMDILISSNLERFLFEVTEHNGAKIDLWFENLKETGRFVIDDETKQKIDNIIVADFCDEKDTIFAINNVYENFDYLMDTHTAVAYSVQKKVRANQEIKNKVIINSTANPYKFSKAVLEAIGTEELPEDEIAILQQLSKESSVEIHKGIKGIEKREILHKDVILIDDMKDYILKIIGR